MREDDWEQIEINMQGVAEDIRAWAEKERLQDEAKATETESAFEGELGSPMIVTHRAFENENSGRQPYEAASVEYDTEATLMANLEFAYRWTQNLYDSWSKNMEHDGHERVTCLVDLTGKLGLRSTSVGDTITIGDTMYVVANFGFTHTNGEAVTDE